MAKEQPSQAQENDAMKDNIRKKFEEMFSDQEPPAYISIHEM